MREKVGEMIMRTGKLIKQHKKQPPITHNTMLKMMFNALDKYKKMAGIL